MVGVGNSAKAAAIAADIGEHTLLTKAAAKDLGTYQGLNDLDLFDMEYWSLEQAKLGKSKGLPFDGRVVAITGGAGAIGSATAAAFRGEGAEIVLLDINQGEVSTTADQIGGFGISCDVTQRDQVESAF